MATKDTRAGSAARKTAELLVVTKNELGALAKLTAPLAKNRINIECFTGYEWSNEVAFRLVTDNNKKAGDLLRAQGYNVQESPVVLWQVDNVPGQLRNATTALAEANVNIYCSYSTSLPNTNTAAVIFNTGDADRTANVLNRQR